MSRSKVKNLLLLKQIHSAVSNIKKGRLDKALETLDKAEKSAKKSKSTDALYYILFTRGGILYLRRREDPVSLGRGWKPSTSHTNFSIFLLLIYSHNIWRYEFTTSNIS